jgi:hypothetical protein
MAHAAHIQTVLESLKTEERAADESEPETKA